MRIWLQRRVVLVSDEPRVYSSLKERKKREEKRREEIQSDISGRTKGG